MSEPKLTSNLGKEIRHKLIVRTDGLPLDMERVLRLDEADEFRWADLIPIENNATQRNATQHVTQTCSTKFFQVFHLYKRSSAVAVILMAPHSNGH